MDCPTILAPRLSNRACARIDDMVFAALRQVKASGVPVARSASPAGATERSSSRLQRRRSTAAAA